MKQASKNYRRQIKRAKANEREHILNVLKSYQSKDPKKIWNVLRNGTGNRKTGDVETLTAENFYEHFVKLNEYLADREESEPTYVDERQEEFGNI